MKKLGVMLLVVISIILLVACKQQSNEKIQFTDFRTIAHAMGGIDNKAYTNSKEAFIEHYSNGTKVFEVDLIETSDGHLVARHDWGNYLYDLLDQTKDTENEVALSLEQFKNKKINKTLTPVDFNDILNLMEKYSDFYLVTDTKSPNKEDSKRIFNKIVELTSIRDEKLLNRIVPQIYNRDMYYIIEEIYSFENILYTLYMDNSTYDEIIDFAVENRIKGIVMSEDRYNRVFVNKLGDNDIKSYIHTINDKDIINKYLEEGIYGIYTDFLFEEDIALLKKIK